MKKLLLPAAAVLALTVAGLLACGNDDPASQGKEILNTTCDNYARCGMLATDLMGMYGNTAEECKQRLASMPTQGTGTGTGGNECPNLKVNDCINAMKAQSCDDLRAGTTLPACECK